MGSLIFPVLLLPFVDLWLLARLALRVGTLPVVGFALLSALLGLAIARGAGQRALRTLGASLELGQLPGDTVVAGAFAMVSAILLILPGFISDALALLLFVPALRAALARRVSVTWGVSQGPASVSGHTAHDPFAPRQHARGATRRGQAPTEVGRIHVRDVIDTTGEEVE